MNQKQIFELMEKFKKCKLGALTVESEGFKISLRNDSSNLTQVVNQSTVAPIHSPASPLADITSELTAAHSPESDHSAKKAKNEIINAPIVGFFYRSPGPDSPPFVEEGSLISAGDSLCIIEAMKIMNKLEAEFACEIIRILAENGQMVEYGEPLFEVRRT